MFLNQLPQTENPQSSQRLSDWCYRSGKVRFGMPSRNPPATWSFKSSSNHSNLIWLSVDGTPHTDPAFRSLDVWASGGTPLASKSSHAQYSKNLRSVKADASEGKVHLYRSAEASNIVEETSKFLTSVKLHSQCPPGQVCVGFHQWCPLNLSCSRKSNKITATPRVSEFPSRLASVALPMFPGSLFLDQFDQRICLGFSSVLRSETRSTQI